MQEYYLYNLVSSIISIFVVTTLIKNYLFLLLAPFYALKERVNYCKAFLRRRAMYGFDLAFTPLITVIVPAWNEEVGILKTVASVIENDYDNFELIVVNDGSTDNSDKIMKQFLVKLGKTNPKVAQKITYIYQKNGGKGKALNTGIKKAKGEIILTIDADSVLKGDALTNLAKYYLDSEIMAVVGNVKVLGDSSLVAMAQRLEYFFGFYNKRGHAVLGAEYIFGGACASFRQGVFAKAGLFDEENKTEDIEMSMRTRHLGMKCTYAENVICYTEGADSWDSLIKQRIRWKKGRLDVFYKYRTLFFSTDANHNFYLSYFILPFSLLSEIQLMFEPIAIAILITYSLITSEFLSLSVGILFILLVYMAASLFSNNRPHLGILLSFPFTWPVFYLLDWVEFIALWKSIKMLASGQQVVWQKWQRQGIGELVLKNSN